MSAEAPTVSVLVTSYNRAKYLAASIESVLAQTFTDFELLVTDDYSTDGSVEIAEAYARRDPRVRVVVNETNLGQFGNRNRAAQLARGRFIKYHDSDDLMYPHCLATMVGPLAAEPSAGLAISGSRHWPGGPCPMLLSSRQCYQREYFGSGLFNLGPACGLFRRDVFLRLGGFPDHGVGSDELFWLHACARENILLVPGDLFWYRIHPGQEFLTSKAARDYAEVFGERWRALHSSACPLTVEERERAKSTVLYYLAKNTWIDLKAGRWSIAWLRLRRTGISLSNWFRYLRRPWRDPYAGTPVDGTGVYLIPDWMRWSAGRAAKNAG